MERVPIKTNPKLFDLEVSKIQNYLADNLSWLDHIFGICEFLTDVKDGKKFTSANIYVGNGNYEQIMPCKELGNFAMFVLRDPQNLSNRYDRFVSAPFSIIFWYNMKDISLPTDERNREFVKAQILGLLHEMHSSKFTITRIYEKPEAVFSDFSYDHTNNQFLMSPYCGLRLDGVIEAIVPCYK